MDIAKMRKKHNKKDDVDQLCQNYLKMDEIGKENLKEVSLKILEIHQKVNEEKLKSNIKITNRSISKK